jgi:glucosylglycerate synthase
MSSSRRQIHEGHEGSCSSWICLVEYRQVRIMKKLKNYASALRPSVLEWATGLADVDILVGIPCFNNEDTIRHVVEMVGRGLSACYPDKKSALLVADGGSLDDTREVAESARIPENVSRMVAIYRGVPGKGTSCRAIFESAMISKADACAVVDADLRSIGPEWVRLLLDPILKGEADFVSPLYTRHKYDGTITNHIVYPFTRALYHRDIRQPIGGDFGFSGSLATFFFQQDVWTTDVARFGIDIWMTTSALAEGHRVVQASLGAKIHDPKDPAEDLGPMFRQVLSTMFYLMGTYEQKWKDTQPVEAVPVWDGTSRSPKLPHVAVTLSKMDQEFADGFLQFRPLYEMVLASATFKEMEGVFKRASAKGLEDFTADLWSRVLYDFAFIYQTWSRNRRRLVDILTPLYFGRVAAYCREVANSSGSEAEEVIQKQAQVFEENKGYLLKKFQAWE